MAHQDVVPVLKVTESRWKYPPYSAHYDGRYIWGRGAVDCKNELIGVLEAFETLLEMDFTPERTILAGFGFDEEISGPQGENLLQSISRRLEVRILSTLLLMNLVWGSGRWMELLLLCQVWARKVSKIPQVDTFS